MTNDLKTVSREQELVMMRTTYFPNEGWALMLSCGFSSEAGLLLRGKRCRGEGGGREGEGGDGGREEDELY